MSQEQLNITLNMLYYFVNQMERVSEPESKLSLSPRALEDDIMVNGFGAEDIDLQERYSRIYDDREHLLRVRAQLQDQLIATQRDNAVLSQRVSSAESQWKEATKQIQADRDFLRRQVADYKQRDTQHQHEVRRLERDAEELREKLRNALNSGAKFSKPAISSLPENFSQPVATSVTTSSSTSLSSGTRSDASSQKLKARIDELERENEQLRVLIQVMTDQVDSLLGSPASGTTKTSTTTQKGNDLSALQSVIKRQMVQLQASYKQSSGVYDNNEVGSLRSQLEECQKLIEEQHKLLKLAITPGPLPGLPGTFTP